MRANGSRRKTRQPAAKTLAHARTNARDLDASLPRFSPYNGYSNLQQGLLMSDTTHDYALPFPLRSIIGA